MYPLWVFTTESDRNRQLSMLRDIFGNPFRPVAVELSWLSPGLVKMAQAIYNDRAFDHLQPLERGQHLAPAGGEVIQREDLVTQRQPVFDQVRAQAAGTAGDEDPHGRYFLPSCLRWVYSPCVPNFW